MTLKILSVDDSKLVRTLVARAFRRFDCVVLEASNGAEGLVVAAKEKPDAIILDITMPVMDGITMLARLKSDPALRPIPVFMLTAESGMESLLKVAKIGVRDYLVKPFREDVLVEKVGRAVTLRPKPAS